jgi:hypothetical protein
MPKTVRITSDGTVGGTKIVDAETGADLSGKCYGFDLADRAGQCPPKATLFCYAELDVTAEADVVEVPKSLTQRARELSDRIGNPAVTAAFAELLGAKMDGGGRDRELQEIVDAIHECGGKIVGLDL